MTATVHFIPEAPASPARETGSGIAKVTPASAAIAVATTAVGYYLGAWLALAFRYPSSVHSVLWPPNAVVLAALMLLPVRLWWLALIAVFPAHLLILPAGWPWAAVLGLFATNVIQAALGAALVARLARDSTSDASFMVAFVVGAVFLSPFLVSFADVGVFFLTGLLTDYWNAWRERFLSNAASIIIFVPPILAVARGWHPGRSLPSKRLLEAALLVGCFVAIGALVIFATSMASSWRPLMLCALLPLLLWAAVRFEELGASCALLGLVAVTMLGIAQWTDMPSAPEEDILMLQAFFLLVSIPVLYLASMHGDLRRYVRAVDATTQRYRIASVAGSVGVWEWNPRTGEFLLDPQLKRLLGYEDREIANRVEAWMPHIHAEDRERVLRSVNAYAAGEAPTFEDEHRMRHKDGSTRWFLSRGAIVPSDTGEPARVFGTCIDVTERRRISDELRDLEILWSAVLSSLTDQIAIVDRSGTIVAVNDAWSRYARDDDMKEWFARTSIGTNYLEVCRGAGRGAETVRAASGISAALDGSDDGFRMEYECSQPAGPSWFEFSAIPLRRSEGGAVISHRDITRRKQAEMEAERQRQEVTHLTRIGVLGHIWGALSHELNQPLTAILANAEAGQRLMAREPVDLAELHACLDDIVEADQRAGEVIARLRSMLKKGDGDFSALDPNAVVKDVLRLVHSDLVMRRVTTTCRLTENLPALYGDRVQLQQLVLNLVVNACEAMSETPVSERILNITTDLGSNGMVRIGIGDSGHGVAEEVQYRLFEPFVTTKKQGLGLGLAICRSIATAHGGFLEAVNNRDRGCTFYVGLPIQR